MNRAAKAARFFIDIEQITFNLNMKKIAVPTDNNGMLDSHFGHCKFFTIIKATDGRIDTEEKVVPPPHEPGVLPKWLAENGVTDVLAGGMGNRAIQIFNQNGVNVFVGAPKMNASELTMGFLDNSIEFTANYCDH
jgi:predicted Fe-Mo cluster-binding NifX family protein